MDETRQGNQDRTISLSTTDRAIPELRNNHVAAWKNTIHKQERSWFLGFVKDLANLIEEKGLEWIGIRQLANVVHCMIGRMSLQSHDVNRITFQSSHKVVIPHLACEYCSVHVLV